MTASNLLGGNTLDIADIPIEPEALRRVPRELALRYDVLSLRTDWDELMVAVAPETGDDVIERVRLATGMRVRTVRAAAPAIRQRLREVYEPEEDAPAVRALDRLYAAAVGAGASDIHIEPEEEGGRARARIDGRLRELGVIAPAVFPHIVSRVKLLAGMDIADRRVPQDGGYRLEYDGRRIDARVSSVPTIFGERLVIRLFDGSEALPRLETLGMTPAMTRTVRAAVRSSSGLVIVCGPTGSGKTTTAYAALAERDATSESICTIEDPVERRLPSAAQVQVNLRAGVSFASAIRAFLRHDPNVIFVGEIRDGETAAIACSAALTGQLVMTTMHSADAVLAIERLRELGIDPRTIAAAVRAIVAQRLIRKRCGCAPGGCSACDGTGYSGRTALFQSVVPGDALRAAVAAGLPAAELRTLACADGSLERVS